MLHKLITEEIQKEIKQSVGETGVTPPYAITITKDGISTLLPDDYSFSAESLQVDYVMHLAPMNHGKDKADDFLLWLSGCIFGLTTAAEHF